jgi:putative membrane protein
MSFIKRIIIGFLVGVGAIMPGASGGAVAMVAGVYDDMISAVANILKKFKDSFLFLLPIGIGALVGIVLFSNIQKWLLEVALIPTMFGFAGLIVGTIPKLYQNANRNGHTLNSYLCFIIALIASLIICFVERQASGGYIYLGSKVVDISFINMIYFIIVGIIMAGSLVIPGISGTVLMILIGAYGLLLTSVANLKDLIPAIINFNFTPDLFQILFVLGFMAVGLAIGALIFSKLMNFLLKKYYTNTHFTILGFVVGSIPALYRGFSFNIMGLAAILIFVAGAMLTFLVAEKAD